MAIKCPKCNVANPDTVKFCGECGTQLPSSKDIHPEVTETLQTSIKELTTGATFAGRYQIIEELGKGGMGKVYRVLDKKLNEEVALKLIKAEISTDKETIQRFSNELKLARKIAHRNVGKMYELMEAEGTHFITMEYVPGQDLRGLIRQTGQLTAAKALSIARQVCEGLAEAHALGVVHRDLKPGNILIDKNGNARIMDFGIARSLKGKGITGLGVMIGTPEYMSPEQVEGKEADQQSDIYSLGIILYEMLTGHVPFEGDTPLAIAVKHKTEAPRDPKLVNAQIPEDLSRVVLKCLEKDKEKRYQSADELHLELEKIEKGIPTTERVMTGRKPFTSKEITVKFSLKKLLIPSLVTVALIITAIIIIWRVIPQKEATPAKSSKHSIAVLPFEDLSPTKDHEYLCDGIAETLINSLSNIKDLWIPARASSFSFRGRNLGIRQIGQQLGVDNLLEASVQVIGNRLRITPKIINVDDGSQIWSNQYDRQMEDVFAIQDEIAREIVKALKITLLGEKEAPLIKSYSDNSEAYQAYLKGRFYWNKRTEEGMRKSIEYFEQAIEKDSSFALAYVGLADAYITLGEWSVLPAKVAFPKAKEAAVRALETDDSLGEAHNSLATVKFGFDWDWKEAEKEYKRAIELSPNYATAHQWYGEFLTYMGRFDEGLKEIKRAQELDPLSLIINVVSGGWFSYLARDYDKGIEQCKKTLEMDPDFFPAHGYLMMNYLGKGMYQEAIREAQKTNNQVAIASIYAMTNRQEEARRLLADILKHPQQLEDRIAGVYFILGENKEGWKWLEKAYDERSYYLTWLKVYPIYDNIRSDPRFQAMLKKMGFE
jgi:serine/threonine protein kinase/tetratricopeptide (TPR) repeat protein